MSRKHTYRILLYLLIITGCTGCKTGISKRLSFWRNDKIPYGTWYAFNHLSYLFTNAEISTWKNSPTAFYGLNQTSSAYIIIGNTVKPDEKELKALLNYAIAGNHVFISAADIGQNLLDSFGISVPPPASATFKPDSLTISAVDPTTSGSLSFSYPGRSLDNYFISMDSSVTRILGKDKEGRANFVKLSFTGGGAFFLHLAPLAFSNFFLLHKDNKRYFDLALSALPDSVSTVWWDDYFRHHIDGEGDAERSAFSKLGVILSHEVLRWAFWLAVLLFALVYLFESKRKQRAVPVIKPHDNASLDFVKTVGRLYFQQKDNKDLAAKMATHFLGHVRSRFRLATSVIDDKFASSLTYKSGYAPERVQEIVQYIHRVENASPFNDGELLAFQEKIDEFYKNT